MKISIITVTKNNKAGLLRAIDCIRNQTYQNIEHIIVDGASTDGTKENLRQAQDDLLPATDYQLHSISEPDNGIYDAINKGIKLATGEVIGLLHSDDLYAHKNVLSEYAKVFSKNNIDAVYSDLVYVKEKSKVKSQISEGNGDQLAEQFTIDHSLLTTNYNTIRYWKTQKKEFNTESKRLRTLLNGWMPPHPTLYIRKTVFDKYGLYDTTFKIAADYEMVLRLFWRHKISTHYLSQTTYLMTIGGASNKSLGNIRLKSKEDYRAMKLNDIPLPSVTLIGKNIRKIPQFLLRS